MTRLAELHPVFFVEEPVLQKDTPDPRLDVVPAGGVTILVPILPEAPGQFGGFNAHNNLLIRELLTDHFSRHLKRPEVIDWYYTPMALGALPSTLTARASIFDAMDELGSFRHAPAELKEREQSLLRQVDLVFSGGPSLHDARKDLHSSAHCFPSGVDEQHFRDAHGAVPDDVPISDSPVIGFYGVLDERVDFDLLARIADLRPQWTLIMIGPVAKISESEMAHRSNIHYLGMRSYNDLPRYLAKFDAAILPFANNESTRFISPTKTLEYLAAGKPVVSTPVRDVVRLYGDVVEIADSSEGFVAAIERLWNESDADRSVRQHMVRNVLSRYHWDAISAQMQSLIRDVLRENSAVHEPGMAKVPASATATSVAFQAPAD